VELLETEGLDPKAVAARIEERREKLRAEVKRGESKLGNRRGSSPKRRPNVVDAERETRSTRTRLSWKELGRIARSDEILQPFARSSWAGSWGSSGCGACARCSACRRTASRRFNVGRDERQDVGDADDGVRLLEAARRHAPVGTISPHIPPPGGSG